LLGQGRTESVEEFTIPRGGLSVGLPSNQTCWVHRRSATSVWKARRWNRRQKNAEGKSWQEKVTGLEGFMGCDDRQPQKWAVQRLEMEECPKGGLESARRSDGVGWSRWWGWSGEKDRRNPNRWVAPIGVLSIKAWRVGLENLASGVWVPPCSSSNRPKSQSVGGTDWSWCTAD
jgi:hypothetical protein